MRLLHWLLAGSIGAAWFTSGQTGALHEWIGYGALAVVAARLLWAFKGNAYARFGQFVKPPRATLAYLRQVAAGQPPRYLGHNPAGGAMVVALLLMVALLAVSGWALGTDLLWGYAWPVRLHVALAWLLAGLVVLHVAGVLLACRQHNENLVAAMVSGDKAAQESPVSPG